MDRVASEYYLWSPEGKPVSVHLSLEVVHALQPVLRSETVTRPLENGGLLFGRVRHVNDSYIVSVEAMEQVECGHVRGASWTLSGSEKHALERRIRRQTGSRTVVGWFRTHTRPGLYLDQHDFNLFNDYFAHPASVALLIRPQDREAAFYFWEDGDIRRASPYQTFPFIPQALGTRRESEFASTDVELVAVPASSLRTPPVVNWRRRALYAAPIAACVLAGFFWQPDIERRRAAEAFEPGRYRQPERAVFPPPETVETPASEPVMEEPPVLAANVVPETPPVRNVVRAKTVRKFSELKPRTRRAVAPEPVLDIPAPRIAVTARLDPAPFVYDKPELPTLQEPVREQKPSKVRRVFGSIPLLGFLKKKKQPRVEETGMAPHEIKGVSAALTSPEDPLSSQGQRLRSPATGSRLRTAAPVDR